MNASKTAGFLLIGLLSPMSALAQDSVEQPITAIANPQATSSGSVTNQAVQVLQGPYITNSYGGGVTCQGPTMNFTPFVSSSYSGRTPWITEQNGEPTYQQDNYSINPGLSLTFSVPLDGGLQERCKKAAETHIARNQAEADKARLDFELVRLLRCGEAIKAGVYFHPSSPYASVCADVVVPGAPTLAVASPPSAQPSGASSASSLPQIRVVPGSRMESSRPSPPSSASASSASPAASSTSAKP
jgi:hypothetical protein